MEQIILFPFGPADVQAQKAYAATIAAEIVNSRTRLPIAQLTGAATLNLTVSDRIPVGSKLIVTASADGTNRTITLGTKLSGLAQTITANKTAVMVFEWNGTAFEHHYTTFQN